MVDSVKLIRFFMLKTMKVTPKPSNTQTIKITTGMIIVLILSFFSLTIGSSSSSDTPFEVSPGTKLIVSEESAPESKLVNAPAAAAFASASAAAFPGLLATGASVLRLLLITASPGSRNVDSTLISMSVRPALRP